MKNVSFGRFSEYTYRNMEEDLNTLSHIFTESLQIDSLGKTEDNREIYRCRIGKARGKEKLLLFGGIHGREYLTSQLLMAQMAELLTRLERGERTYQGKTYEELMWRREVHLVPMANPDGVSISQFGAKGLQSKTLREEALKIAEAERKNMEYAAYFTEWKANARGVDLNRNFDALWEEYQTGKAKPSAESYKGAAPESEKETKALADLTRRERFLRTISYHSSGSVIYWNFGQKGELKKTTKAFAQRIAQVTGYELEGSWDTLDPAGYKDWALLHMKIPSLTIEIGKQASPLPGSCFPEIFRENRGVWEETLLSLED